MKPTWIRVVGWTAFGMWYLLIGHLSHAGISKIPAEDARAYVVLSIAGSVGALAWLIATVLWKFQRRQARATVAALGHEQTRSSLSLPHSNPTWIRAFGWATGAYLWVSWWLLGASVKAPLVSNLRDTGSLLGLAGLVCGVVWATGTLSRRLTGSKVQTLRTAAASSNTEGLFPCQRCGMFQRHLHCLRHSISLCYPCARAHDVIGECSYIPTWRPGLAPLGPSPTAEAKPGRVVTSPLHGMR